MPAVGQSGSLQLTYGRPRLSWRPLAGPALRWRAKVDGRASQQCLSRQVSQHGRAGFLGLSERFEGRAADLDGARFLMMDRTPGRHEAGSSVKAGTAAALIADHERKAVAAPAPYFHVRDGTNDAAELHGHSHRRPTSSVGSTDDQTLSQRWFQARQRGYPRTRADSETGRGFAGGAPASSDTGAAVDSPAGLLEHRKAIQQGILKYFAGNERLDAYRETGERQSTRSTG